METKLQIRRGDNWPIKIRITAPVGTTLDFTGAAITFCLARNDGPYGRARPLLCLTGARLTVVTAGNVATITGNLTPSETSALPPIELFASCYHQATGETKTWLEKRAQIL